MASHSTTSWLQLRALRRRGQKPGLPVFISDQYVMLHGTGLLMLPAPFEGDEELLVGLDVVAVLEKSDHNYDVAQRMAAAGPATLTIVWRGADVQRVLP